MAAHRERKNMNDYKVIISELKTNPFRVIKIAFLLIGIVPLLSFLYIMMRGHFNLDVFLGSSGLTGIIAISISLLGFLYAYNFVVNMVKRLLDYFYERKCADDEKTELIIGVSHDLRTPVAVIKSGLDNVIEGVAGPLNKTQAEIIRKCLSSVDRLGDFISGLVDISKISFVRTNLKRAPIDFGEVVKNEVARISGPAKVKGREFKYKISTTATTIWADKDKLSKAVMYLFSDISKHASSGSKINVTLAGDEITMQLTVTSKGAMIWPVEFGAIFNKIERPQEHAGIKETGLNLSVVKDIVDLHNGHITARSDPGKEVEFNMILPKDLRQQAGSSGIFPGFIG